MTTSSLPAALQDELQRGLSTLGLDAATLQVRLLELELEGRVARRPGGLFQRTGQD